MSETQLPPIPTKAAVIDKNGMITFAWSQWFLQLFARAGGALAPSNSSITTVSNTVSGQGTSLTSLQTQVNSLQNQVGGLTKGRDL